MQSGRFPRGGELFGLLRLVHILQKVPDRELESWIAPWSVTVSMFRIIGASRRSGANCVRADAGPKIDQHPPI